jgi:hypothetical protein
MEKVTEREAIKKAIAGGLVEFRGEQEWKLRLFRNLSELDPETCTTKDVDKAMIGRWWSRCYCDECAKEVKEIVVFGEDDIYAERDPRMNLCKDCLRKALEL